LKQTVYVEWLKTLVESFNLRWIAQENLTLSSACLRASVIYSRIKWGSSSHSCYQDVLKSS